MSNQMSDLFKNTVAYETVEKIGAINTQVLSKLTALQMDIATFGIESTLAQTKLLSSPDNYKDFFSIKSDFTKLCCDRLMNISKQSTEILIDSGDELFAAVDGLISVGQSRPVSKVKASQVIKTVKKSATNKTSKSHSTVRKTTAKKKTVIKKNK
jgi:phasin family protein